MLKALTVERYRCFVAPARIDLRPLTVLFGRNSVGKSALLRALPIVAASCAAAPNRSGPLALEHPAAMSARYGDVRTNLAPRNDLGLLLSWGVDSRIENVSIGVREMADLNSSRQVVERWSASTAQGERIHAELDPDRGLLVAAGEPPREFDLVGLTPRVTEDGRNDDGVLWRAAAAMRELAGRVDWLGAFRTAPPRTRVPRIARATLGPYGEHITEVLADLEPDGFEFVRSAVQSVFGCDIEVVDEGGEVWLAVREGPRRSHVLDVGGGVSHILPVFARLAEVALNPQRARIVTIEQPEVHLHPAAEAKLAAVVVDCIEKGRHAAQRSCVVLETHSENLLLSLQLAILEKRLAPNDVILHWLDRLDDGSVVVQSKEITTRGEIDPPLPPGVFSEGIDLARRVVRARSERRS